MSGDSMGHVTRFVLFLVLSSCSETTKIRMVCTVGQTTCTASGLTMVCIGERWIARPQEYDCEPNRSEPRDSN